MARPKPKPKSTVLPRPLPLILVRAQAVAEGVAAAGGSTQDIDITQRGVAGRYLSEVVVYGIAADGTARDKFAINLDANDGGEVNVDDHGGTRSMLEALDAGLARAVAYQAARMKRKGLTPDVRFVFRDEIYQDEQRLAEARATLGIEAAAPPSYRKGRKPREILRIRPLGRDPGFTASFYDDNDED